MNKTKYTPNLSKESASYDKGYVGKLKNGLIKVKNLAEEHPLATGALITIVYTGVAALAGYSLKPDPPTNPSGIYEVQFNPILYPVSHLVKNFSEGTGSIGGTVRGYDGNVARTILENFKVNTPAYLAPLVGGMAAKIKTGKHAKKA